MEAVQQLLFYSHQTLIEECQSRLLHANVEENLNVLMGQLCTNASGHPRRLLCCLPMPPPESGLRT